MNNDIIGFTDPQVRPSDSTCKIIETLNFYNNKNKFYSLAYGCRNDIAILNKFDANEVSILFFKKHTFFANRVFTLMLIYNLLKASQNKFLDIFTDDFQMLNKPTHTSRSLIDHDSVKKAFMEGLFINITAEKKFFSDDAIRTVIEKSSVDFHIYL